MTHTRRLGTALLLAVGLLASLLLVVGGSTPASAATGTVRGQVTGSEPGRVRVKVLWFTRDWHYLGQRRVDGDIYSLSLPRGTYHLQFVDLRPSYDVSKYAPSDVEVTIGAAPVQRDVRMRRGAAITGTVRGGGRALAGARVVAANADQQSYETRANSRGEFAVGGLPAGSYSLFTYDRQQAWVGKSLWVPSMKRGEARDVAVRLRTHGGSLLVDLRRGDGTTMGGSFFVTAVSKESGQFWTAKATGGTVSLQGLFPGRYTLVAPGVGDWLARTGAIRGAFVRAGRADLASTFTWTRRGARVTGTVLDAEDPSYVLEHAQVLLFDRDGTQLGSAFTGSSGRFSIGGQLTTQEGLSVVVNPDPDTGGWMQAALYCPYTPTRVTGVAVTTGQADDVGEVLLPHKAGSATPTFCRPSTP